MYAVAVSIHQSRIQLAAIQQAVEIQVLVAVQEAVVVTVGVQRIGCGGPGVAIGDADVKDFLNGSPSFIGAQLTGPANT